MPLRASLRFALLNLPDRCLTRGPTMFLRTLLTTLSAAALAGCASLPKEVDEGRQFEGALASAEKPLVNNPPELGLALSGGGYRSALYSIGALKRLYDADILPRVDYLSTVSGGGYTGYWLMTAQADARRRGQATQFGEGRLADAHFARSLCEAETNANFVTFGQMFRSTMRKRTFEMYQNQIVRAFGSRDDPAFKLAELMPTSATGTPYLIVNTSVRSPKPHGWRDGLLEMTPVGVRQGDGPLVPWQPEQSILYRRAVTMSGAAFDPVLKQDLTLPGTQTRLTVYDGGGSENAGAIALIRRGVKKIVIVDAEHDPKYGFGAYANLRDRLSKWGVEFRSREIEQYVDHRQGLPPNQSVFHFNARSMAGGPINSQIVYIKMSLPERLRQSLASDWLGTGKPLPPDVQSFQRLMAPDPVTGRIECGKFDQVSLANLRDFLAFSTARYGAFWNANPAAEPSSISMLTLNFPHYSTVDQSMFRDQALAFIGLGYLQANEWDGAWPK